MKIRDIIANADKSNGSCMIYCDDLASELGLDSYQIDIDGDSELLEHSLSTWTCTDRGVGLSLITLKGLNVAVSAQPYRRSHKEFEWLSPEFPLMVENYMKSFMRNENESYTLLDLDLEFKEGYGINSMSQLIRSIHKNVIVEGVVYPVHEDTDMSRNNNNDFLYINVDEKKKKVKLEDCLFPWISK